MGGTQRIAERAGPARARELVMSGGLYDAATLERWNVVNRVLPDSELAEKSIRCARFWRTACAAPTTRRPRSERRCSRRTTCGGRWRASWRKGPERRRSRVLNRFPPPSPGSVAPSVSAKADVVEHAGAVDGFADATPAGHTQEGAIQVPTGTVKWFNDEKGYGFITPDDGDRDLFVHYTGIDGQGFKSLAENSKVEYEEETGDKGPKAVNVRAI